MTRTEKPAPRWNPRATEQERCIALVDARFLDWLCGKDSEGGESQPARRERLQGLLEDALAQVQVAAQVVRVYWYSSHAASQTIDGHLLRWVRPEAADGGVSLLQALSRDLAQLAQHRACEHVLVVSDDDRLLPAIDAAQLHGMMVHLLADESAADLAALARTDAPWVSLLRQGDRRVVVSSADLEQTLWGDGLAPHKAPRGRQGPAATEAGPLREALESMVTRWWAEVPESARQDLYAHLPNQRGLPQEADRQLLLHLSQQLGRPLAVPEKRLMRELARAVALADDGSPQGLAPPEAAPLATPEEAPQPADH